MRRNLLVSFMVPVLLCLSLTAVGLSARYYFAYNEFQRLQFQYYQANQTVMATQSLINQCIQYGKQNSSIFGILSEFDSKAFTNTAAFLPPATLQPTP